MVNFLWSAAPRQASPVRRCGTLPSFWHFQSIANSVLPRSGGPLSMAAMCLLVAAIAFAQPAAPAKPAGEQPLREIFVPFEDLNIILESPMQRVFLTRGEYDELVEKAKTKPQTNVPHKLTMLSAEYDARLEEGRALLSGNLTLEVLDEGLFALPLDLTGVGIRSAILDGKPAPLSRDAKQKPILLVQGKGTHKLALELTAPLATAAAQQSLHMTLPTNSAARLKLTVPGNVEVKGGAAVIDRQYDMAANLTRLEILPQRGGMAIVMSLNNKLLREQRVVVARSVIVSEVTLGYERIHATVSHRVLHGAVDKLRFSVPAGFEVTRVEATQIARWEEKANPDGTATLEATLREPTTDQVVLEISANRSPAANEDWLAGLANWKFPRLVPLDVSGQVAVVGLLVEDRLKAESVAATGLLPIDAAVLVSAIPASVLNAEPGSPSVRQVVTYYAPTADYELSARFVKPPTGLRVATNSLLVVADGGLTLTGGFALTPEAESLFEFRFTVPKLWQVKQVTRADGTPLAIERYPTTDGGTRILVRLGSGIAVGQSATVNFEALSTPAGWLAEWTSQQVEFPQLVVEGATADSGAVAAQTLDDLVVRPDKLTGLTPLLDAEKAAFGLADLPTAVAYRYIARPFGVTLVVERTKPSLVAEVFSFLKIEPDNLVAHYELNYQVREARTRELVFSLPAKTPAELTVRGLGNTVVKEYRGEEVDGRRRWRVQLAERQMGLVRLAVDFQQRLSEGTLTKHPLPLVQAEGVDYQSAYVAVEGDAELDVTVATAARSIDVGELAGAEYLVGRRVVGAFGYVGTKAEVLVDVARRDQYPLPPALVQRATLTTKVSAAGRMQSLAAYELLTKATLLEIQLPAGSTLWTIFVDDQPTKPQREGQSLLLSLPAQQRLAARSLKIVYETEAPSGQPLGLSGEVTAAAPTLLVRAKGTDAEREIPQADLVWTLHLPTGYLLKRSDGTVDTDAIPPREMAAVKVARFVYDFAGGVNPFYWVGSVQSAYPLSATNDIYGHAEGGRFDYAPAGAMPAPTTASPALPFEADMPAPAAEAKPAEAPTAETPPLPAPVAPPMAAPTPAPAPPVDPAAIPRLEMPQDLQEGGMQNQSSKNTAEKNFEELKSRITTTIAPQSWSDVQSLQGVSSLKIDLQADLGGDSATFRSLGAAPVLRAAVVDSRRMLAAAVGLPLLILLVGVGLTFQPVRRKATFIIVVLLASSVPLLLTDRLDEIAVVLDYIFFAGCALAVYFPLAAFVLAVGRWIKKKAGACCAVPTTHPFQQIAGLMIALTLVLAGGTALAQEPPAAPAAPAPPALPQEVEIVNLKDILPLLDTGGPVAVPADAVIVPYDPDKPIDQAAGQKILVPYANYVQLWNRANPDKKIAPAKLPADFALAGARYEATLAAADSLQLAGTIEIDVFSEKPIAVPLHLAGGVLVKATVDGGAARLQVVEPAPAQPQPKGQQAAQKVAPNASPPADGVPARMLLLHLSGTGRKKLAVTIQMGVTRQGGWRIVRGQLPVGPAAALTLSVPEAGTEVRQQSLADKPLFETKADGEKIETSLAATGALDLQWRAKVSEGQVDQSLTARSLAVLDVREDSLRLVWQVKLDFGRALRDSFTLVAPKEFLVEQVTGANLRGWTMKTVGDQQMVDVTLLKAVQGSETLTIHLARRGRVGQGDLAEFDAPMVQVDTAMLQQGEIAVRRSPRLDLRAVEMKGLSRADADGQTAAVEQIADATDAAVLVVKPFQTYKFVRPPFSLRLAAAEFTATTTAEVRAALRVAERDTTLDAAIIFRPQGEPLFKAQVVLPQGFELDRIGPGDLEYAIATAGGKKTLTVYLQGGQTGEFTLTLFGRIIGVGDPPSANGEPKPRKMPIPVLQVLGVGKQEGELLILPDPDTDVRLEDVKNADTSLVIDKIFWCAADQRPLVKLALKLRSADYSATLVLTPRTPQVSVRTISNVKITSKAIEETILLNFAIEEAGIRRLSFLLPESLAKARLNVRLLKSKTVEPATDADGKPLAGWVRFKLELQDYVRDEFGVIVMHDRLLTADQQTIALPRVETGRTDERLIALENAGRDEVVIDPKGTVGLASLSPQQQAWRDLTAILGNNLTQAWQANEDQAQPTLQFQTKERAQAETATARIELGSTLLVLDRAGTYRALQEYRITNATMQFLEVELPAGAQLWTATVAGEPAKPVELSPPKPGFVRIPLVKTAEGEGDYAVQLKYGGRLAPVSSLGQINFPLLKTVNISVELSQVRLFLPESQTWFNFGGSMRKVDGTEALDELYQSYLNKRISAAEQLLTCDNPFTQLRAQNNLKQAKLLFDTSRANTAGVQTRSGQALHMSNEALLNKAEQQVQRQAAQQMDLGDNRGRLNEYWGMQTLNRSKNVVSSLRSNFDGIKQQDEAAQALDAFNPQFLDQNSLNTKGDVSGNKGKSGKDASAKQPATQGEGRAANRFARGTVLPSGKPESQAGSGPQQGQGQQSAPQLFNDAQKETLQKKLQSEAGEKVAQEQDGRQQQQANLSKYNERLQEQNRRDQQQLELNNDLSLQIQQSQLPAQPMAPQSGQSAGGVQMGNFGGAGGGAGFGVPGNQPGLPAINGPVASTTPMASEPGRPFVTSVIPVIDGQSPGVQLDDYAALATGLASLDFELPQRGQVFNFTTPRGQIEITARPLADSLARRLIGLAGVALAVLVVWLLTRSPVRQFCRQACGTTACGVLVALVGLLSIITGIFPVAGLLLLAAGIILAIRSRCCPACAA